MRLVRVPITVVVAILVALTLVTVAPSASAAVPPYPAGCTVQLSKVSAFPGDQLTVTASGYPVGSVVTFVLDRPGQGNPPPQSGNGAVTLGSATADANGVATLVFTLPIGTKPGQHVVTASGQPAGTCDQLVSTVLMVDAATVATSTPPATSAGTGTLPRTGTNSAELIQLALVLIAVGGLITLATRKRLQRAHVKS
jgi:hypothetical protein